MGNCSAARGEYRQAVLESKRIDRRLKEDYNLQSRTLDLLLLGKDKNNAFMQQLRNRFTVEWDDLSERGREDRRQEVFRHIIKQMAALLEATERHEEVKVEGKERLYRDAERCQRGVVIEMDAELRHCLVALWGNSEIQANFQQHHTEPACQTLEYFMQDAGLILEGGPITNPDLRRIPYSSVGLGSLLYTRNNVMFRICDGRKLITEEKKWLSMLDMEAVFYLVPLDDYDKGLEEDPTVNALEDTMARFSRILDLEHFRMTGVFLFFTNIVAFREKLLLTPIKAHDPANPQFDRWTDYTGLEGIAETDADARIAAEEGIQFFQNKFLAANQEAQRGIYIHSLEVEDGEMFDIVHGAVEMALLTSCSFPLEIWD